MDGLRFLETWSIKQFKEEQQIKKIEIKKNEATGKCFFTFGFETGACSKKIDFQDVSKAVISKVCESQTGDLFYLLHQKGEPKAMTIATL